MSESIPPLDPDLVGALREAEPAPAAVRARARQRLMSAVGGLGGRRGGGGGGAGGATGVSGRTMGPGMPGAIAFVLGGVVGVGLYVALAPAPAARVVYVDRIVPAPPTAPVATAAPVTAVAAGAVSTASGATTPAAPTAASTRASQLSAERILLDEARAALAQGDPARALDRLERHRRTFPAPLLGEERDAMWVQALVKAGRYDEARSHASAFHKRSPDSLFSSGVDSAIDSIP